MKYQQILQSVGAAIVLSATAAPAANVTWNGGAADNNWDTAANWSSNPNLPLTGLGSAGDVLFIDADAANNHAIYTATQGNRFYNKVQVGSGANGRLDVTGGLLVGDNTGNAFVGRQGRTGTLNIAGGIYRTGGPAIIGIDNNSVGIANLTSGALEANRGGTLDGIANVSLALGGGGTAQGTLNLSGGNLYTRFGVAVGHSSLAGAGTFNVLGSGFTAKIGTLNGANATSAGFWRQRGNGTLAATVDSGSFSLGVIQILNSTTPAAFVTFDANSKLDLGFSSAAPGATMSWDLMTWDDNTTFANNGLTLDAADVAAGWSFSFADTGGTAALNALRITFTSVPEPSALALMGLGALLLAPRRK